MALMSHTSTVERLARVLAGLTLSRNARGTDAHAGEEVDRRWQDFVPDAEAVLKTLREAGPEMTAVGDPVLWERMVRAALGQPDEGIPNPTH